MKTRRVWLTSLAVLLTAFLWFGGISACTGWPIYSPPPILIEAFGGFCLGFVGGGPETDRRLTEFLLDRFPAGSSEAMLRSTLLDQGFQNFLPLDYCQSPVDRGHQVIQSALCATVDPARALIFRWAVMCRHDVQVEWSAMEGRLVSVKGTYQSCPL